MLTGTDIFDIIYELVGSKADREDLAAGRKHIARMKTQSSIKTQAKNLILQYPMLFSDDNSTSSMELISRAMEADYTSLMLVVLNKELSYYMDSSASSLEDILKKYHTNIDASRGLGIVNEQGEDIFLRPFFANVDRAMSKNTLYEACQTLLLTPEECYKRSVLNESIIPKCLLDEAGLTYHKDSVEGVNGGTYITNQNKVRPVMESFDIPLSEDGQSGVEVKSVSRPKRTAQGGSMDAKVSTVDFKKLNNLMPTLVTVKLRLIDKESRTPFEKEAMFGIKAVVHPLKSDDIRYYLANQVKDKFKLFRLIQWTTGEIKLVKDLILNQDAVKKTALDSKYKNTFWWRKLSSLANSSKIKALMNSKNAPIATATMCITMNDVNAIKNKNGIDLLNDMKAVDSIVKNYFLLGFIVVDDATEAVYIWNSDSKSFNYHTFKSIDKYGKERESGLDAMSALKSLLS